MNKSIFKIKQGYDRWSSTYDKDVANEGYCGPDYIASYFDLLLKQNGKSLDLRNSAIEILDSGCGTGLVGVALHRKGYSQIDGFDLSHGMTEKAKEKRVYRNLTGGCDMTQPIKVYTDNRYDASISCGVFTKGDFGVSTTGLPPTALEEMIRFTKPGGLVVVSTRKSYYDTTDFQGVYERLQDKNKIKLVSFVLDGPYILEENAHYWAFRVC